MHQFIAWLDIHDFPETSRDLCGYLAAALVLATFSMTSMRRLRIAAIASNIAFIVYALTVHLHPILLLHGTLLPLNIIRLVQIERERAASLPVVFLGASD